MARTVMRAIGALMGVAMLAALGAAPAGAVTGTLAIGVPPDPIRLTPTAVTFSGSVDEPAFLNATSNLGFECEHSPSQYGVQLVPKAGQLVGPGPFSVSVPVLIGSTRPFPTRDHFCGWLTSVTESGFSGPVIAAVELEPSLRRPVASVAVAQTPMEKDVPGTVTVSGSVDAPRRLDVLLGGYCVGEDEEPERGAGVDSAAHDDIPRLTPRDGVTVGPGAFSVALPWTPGTANAPDAYCVYLSAPGELGFPETKVMELIDWALPRITVRSPADGASGRTLNPRFLWEPSGSRRNPPAADAVELWRVEGDQLLPLAQISGTRWRVLSQHARRYLGRIAGGGGRTDDVAFIYPGSLKLIDGFSPGTYEWRVTRAGHQPSQPRRFTVEPVPLRRLKVKQGWYSGDSSARPFAFRLDVKGVPFSTYRREWRVAGGRWSATEWRTRQWGDTTDLIWTSCNRAGGIVDWRLYARDALGTIRTREGRFYNVRRADCARMRRDEATNRRYRRACRSIGGRAIQRRDGWICRTPPGTPPRQVPGF